MEIYGWVENQAIYAYLDNGTSPTNVPVNPFMQRWQSVLAAYDNINEIVLIDASSTIADMSIYIELPYDEE